MSTAGPRPNTAPPWREALIGAVVLLVLVGGLSWWLTSPTGNRRREERRSDEGATTAGMYVGSKVCGECHPGELASYGGSGHSRTLRPAASTKLARQLDGRHVADPELAGVTWSYRLSDGEFSVSRAEAGESESWIIDFALGSGQHATTFVSLSGRDTPDPDGFEHRLTYFAHDESLGLTPGQSARSKTPGRTPQGFHLPKLATLDCFGCHATRTSAESPMTLDLATLIPNVSCERCHGPAKAHVEAARRGLTGLIMRHGPARETADSQMRLCGKCHRLPEMVQPASSIRPSNRSLARFPSVGLSQSACYIRGRGALRCTTCHDPHARSSTDRPAYEARCLECHQAGSKEACPVSPRSGCIECHMPKHDVGHGMLFTDHWIRAETSGVNGRP